MSDTVSLPRPLAHTTTARLRRLAEAHGVRRAADAIGVTRHTFLVAVAGLPLDDAQRATLERGLGQLDCSTGGE